MADQNGNISLVWGENDAHYNLRNFWRFTSCNDDNFIQILTIKQKLLKWRKKLIQILLIKRSHRMAQFTLCNGCKFIQILYNKTSIVVMIRETFVNCFHSLYPVWFQSSVLTDKNSKQHLIFQTYTLKHFCSNSFIPSSLSKSPSRISVTSRHQINWDTVSTTCRWKNHL